MKLEIKEVFWLTVVITGLLFFTGIAVVPFTTSLTTDPYTQNIMYAIGRLPVVFTAIYFYLSLLGEKR
jgi:hypothetical protein